MIDDLLLYSKLDLNQLPYHFEITDLRRYFEDCLEDYRYAYVQAGVELTLSDRLQKPMMIRIDRERFKRVMQNILDNALKHVPQDNSGGKVELILRETRTSAIIEVRDNGPGIAPRNICRISSSASTAATARAPMRRAAVWAWRLRSRSWRGVGPGVLGRQQARRRDADDDLAAQVVRV